MYAVPPGGAAAVREQDTKTPGPGCWVDTWAPGATETLLTQDAGGHMHMLGRAMKVELNPGTPNA